MEVIRGPESVLFGAEASSAVIQMFTERGDPEATRPHGSLAYERGIIFHGPLDGRAERRIREPRWTTHSPRISSAPPASFRTTRSASPAARPTSASDFSDATQLRAVYRDLRFLHRRSGAGGVRADEFRCEREGSRCSRERAAGRPARNRFSQRVLFGYHRYRDTFSDNVTEDYDVSAFVNRDRSEDLFRRVSRRQARQAPCRDSATCSPLPDSPSPIAPAPAIRALSRIAAARWCSATTTNGRPADFRPPMWRATTTESMCTSNTRSRRESL